MVGKGEIKLRAIEINDLELIQKWRNNPELRKFFREYRDFSVLQINNWYENMIHSKDFEMFIICSKDQPVGVTGLTYIDWTNRHADVHFYIGNNGSWIEDKISPVALELILSYGFNTLNLNKLWAEIYEIDVLKTSFFKKRKFKQDALLREHYYYEGKYYNSQILSLLKKDFEK